MLILEALCLWLPQGVLEPQPHGAVECLRAARLISAGAEKWGVSVSGVVTESATVAVNVTAPIDAQDTRMGTPKGWLVAREVTSGGRFAWNPPLAPASTATAPCCPKALRKSLIFASSDFCQAPGAGAIWSCLGNAISANAGIRWKVRMAKSWRKMEGRKMEKREAVVW